MVTGSFLDAVAPQEVKENWSFLLEPKQQKILFSRENIDFHKIEKKA